MEILMVSQKLREDFLRDMGPMMIMSDFPQLSWWKLFCIRDLNSVR